MKCTMVVLDYPLIFLLLLLAQSRSEYLTPWTAADVYILRDGPHGDDIHRHSTPRQVRQHWYLQQYLGLMLHSSSRPCPYCMTRDRSSSSTTISCDTYSAFEKGHSHSSQLPACACGESWVLFVFPSPVGMQITCSITAVCMHYCYTVLVLVVFCSSVRIHGNIINLWYGIW